jgi:hypothetical protein
MRKRKSILKTLAIVFMIMFLGNMAVMRLFFGINVLGAAKRSGDTAERGKLLNREKLLLREVSEQEFPPMQEQPPDREMHPTQEAQETVSFDPVEVLQHLSLTDKLFVLSILPKIGREGMNLLIELSDDGLAPDEYEEIKKLAENSLKPSDIEKLKEIFYKNQGLFAQNPGE